MSVHFFFSYADLSNCLTIHILSLVNCYSLFVATCRILQGSAQPQASHAYSAMTEHSPNTEISPPSFEQNKLALPLSSLQFPHTQCSRQAPVEEMSRCIGSPERGEVRSKLHKSSDRHGDLTVFFSQRCAKYLGLSVGSHVRIHPPWWESVYILTNRKFQCCSITLSLPTSRQCLHLPSLSHDVILCTHFCQLVGHTHVPTDTTPISPIPCKQRGVAGVYSLLSPEKTPLPAHPMLTKSPVKV